MSDMFNSCTSLIKLNLLKFDTSSLTDMSGMFYNCNSLTNLDLSSFNTSKVVKMIKTFDDLTYRVSEDTRLVVVTVRMDRIHSETFPHREEKGIFFFEERFEIH